MTAGITVQQLRQMLYRFPDDAIVVISKDGEGNRFSPLAENDPISTGQYRAETTWTGEFYDPAEWGDDPTAVRAICLWPIS